MHRAADPAIADDEDLVANARTALRVAAELCTDACDWYHALYPVLRLLGLAATPARHARFYREALAALRGGPRVLVAGAADTAMPSLVANAMAGARIAVLDRCETPLLLCREQATRRGVALTTQRTDLLAPAARAPGFEPVDLVCTHSLLTTIPPGERERAVAALGARLAREGRLVSTARIDATTPLTRFDADVAARFVARVEAGAAPLCAVLEVEPDRIATLAQRYTETTRSWPFASAEAVARTLEAGGLRVERLDVVEVGGTLARDTGGAGTDRAAVYAEFVATRAGSRPSSSPAK